jgi:hypothetical protein
VLLQSTIDLFGTMNMEYSRLFIIYPAQCAVLYITSICKQPGGEESTELLKKKLELNSTYLQNGLPMLGKILIEQTS